MSNSTAEAPVKASPAPPASSPAGAVEVPSYSISWLGIAGILVAFLVLVLIALVCFRCKKRAFKRALKEQRERYSANGTSTLKVDWSDDEEAARSKKGQLTLAEFEQVATAKGFDNGGTTKAPEHDIPIIARDKHVVEAVKEGSRNKNMSGGFSLGQSVKDEVFYKEEGSQMGVRYTSSDFDNLDIFSRVPRQKRPESESASLLASFCRSHTIAAATEVENPTSWTLRTLSLPASTHKPEPQPSDAGVDVRVESLSKGIGSVESKPSSPKHSYSPKFAYGNISLAPWTQKPSRLSVQSNAAPTFIVPPSTPPPPLPLPVSLDDAEEKTLIELRKAMKQAETKWSVANYCPSAPPPPLPVPLQPSSPSSTSPPSPSPKPAPPPPPPPPPFPTLPCKRFPQPPSSPPPPSLPSRNSTPPPSPPPSSPPPPPTPPPSPPPFPTLPCKRFAPPPSPPPPALPGSSSRPKLTPLILPGRSENAEEFRTEPRPPRRTQSKMRPLHWDKLKPESRTTMVWDNISNSMELDEEMIENLFGVTARAGAESDSVKKSLFTPVAAERNEILEPRKAHNIAIQLRARGLSRVEVCDALLEGDGLSQEILEILVKMALTEEEATKFQEYQGDATLLGPADRFILGILQIPRAFERLHAMHYKASYAEELHHIQDTITTLEMACKELKGSRTFTKLLEAVLKTGNRLNTGTFRGDAKAFKLDTLLKLADVKGIDGKTTLLHFVIQEIIKAEGARAARMAGSSLHDPSTPTSTRSSSVCTTPASPSSPLSHFARTMESDFEHDDSTTPDHDFRKIGMNVVRGIPTELSHVRKAGALDIQALRLAVTKLHSGLQGTKNLVSFSNLASSSNLVSSTSRNLTSTTSENLASSTSRNLTSTTSENLASSTSRNLVSTVENLASSTTYDLADDVFREKLHHFLADAEQQVASIQRDLDLVLASVKDISVYFYGEADAAKLITAQQPLKVFLVLREFLAMLEQACRDVVMASGSSVASTPPGSRPPSRPRGVVMANE